ncbi:hypothetical protein AAY473_005274 [Plecturocebus cupreus]
MEEVEVSHHPLQILWAATGGRVDTEQQRAPLLQLHPIPWDPLRPLNAKNWAQATQMVQYENQVLSGHHQDAHSKSEEKGSGSTHYRPTGPVRMKESPWTLLLQHRPDALPGLLHRLMVEKSFTAIVRQSPSVTQAGVQWHDLGALQPLPPGFKRLIRWGFAMLARLVLNSWPQRIQLPRPPKTKSRSVTQAGVQWPDLAHCNHHHLGSSDSPASAS